MAPRVGKNPMPTGASTQVAVISSGTVKLIATSIHEPLDELSGRTSDEGWGSVKNPKTSRKSVQLRLAIAFAVSGCMDVVLFKAIWSH